MSTIAVNAITDASSGSTTTINGVTPNVNNVVGKNKIINGNMMIDQRNSGASIDTGQYYNYTVDRWVAFNNVGTGKYTIQQNAGSVAPPENFSSYVGATSSSAYTSLGSTDSFNLYQRIEGLNTSDLDFGKSTAKSITLSFYVRSSLTGTFGGVIASNNRTRTYPFTYAISSANTWEKKTITIAGDTSGTWLTTNGIGVELIFQLGSGSGVLGTAGQWASANVTGVTGATNLVSTNGATWYLTGVQLEAGSSATEFEHRPYTTELQLCQRYFEKLNGIVYGSYIGSFGASYATWFFSTEKRTAPTMNFVGSTGTAQNVSTQSADVYASSTYPRVGAGTTASSEL